jgi:hypothetical protein
MIYILFFIFDKVRNLYFFIEFYLFLTILICLTPLRRLISCNRGIKMIVYIFFFEGKILIYKMRTN